MRLDVQNVPSLDTNYNWKTVGNFRGSYWSGLDARIYAGSVLLDEILTLQYTLQEAVLPLFGYASYVYDSVIHGARRVQGAFTINYTREDWLFELLGELTRETTNTIPPSFKNPEAFRIAQNNGATLEEFIALAASDGSVSHISSGGMLQVDPTLLNDVANIFQSAIWNQTPRDPTNSSTARQVALTALEPLSSRVARFQLKKNFDLAIHFGSSRQTKFSPTQIVGGQTAEVVQGAPVEVAVETSFRITGVELTGVEKVVDDSGRCVMESYSYIARDIA